MIYVCERCSNINIEELKKVIPASELKLTCIAECWKYKDKAYGFFGDDFVVKDTEAEFIEAARAYLGK